MTGLDVFLGVCLEGLLLLVVGDMIVEKENPLVGRRNLPPSPADSFRSDR